MLNYQELYDKVNLYIENMPYNAQIRRETYSTSPHANGLQPL